MIPYVGNISFADYTAAIRNHAKQHVRVAFPNQNVVIDEQHIRIDEINYEFYMNANPDIALDSAPSAHIIVPLLNADGSLSGIDFTDEFVVSLGVEINNTVVYQPLGTFIGTKPEKVLVDQIDLEGHDRMVLFEVDADKFFLSESLPKNLSNYYADLCTFVGVPYKAIPSHAINTNRSYNAHPTMGVGVTCKTILACIAEAMGCYVRIAKDGEVELVWFGDHTADYTAYRSDYFEIDAAEYEVSQIEKVQVKVTDNDIGVIVPADSTDTNCYTIVDNPFLYGDSDSDIRPWATNIYNRMTAIPEYRPMNVTLDGCWLVEPGDIISVETSNNVFEDMFIFNMTMRWNGMATITYECTGNKDRGEMTQANRRMIESAAKYHEIVIDIDQLYSEIGDRSGHTSTIQQEINSIESRISSLGYGTIYMQPDEPDHDELVAGDIWIQSQSYNTWGAVKQQYTWGQAKRFAWQTLRGIAKMYYYDGVRFIELYDANLPTNLETRITQTEQQILLMATKSELNLTNMQVSTLSAQVDIQAGEIQSTVEAINAKPNTYISWEQPSGQDIHAGDVWVKEAKQMSSWTEAKKTTWQVIKGKYTWHAGHGSESYVYDGTVWIMTSSRADEVEQRTMIDQTNTRITLLAEEQVKIGDAVVRNSARIDVTATQVSSLVTSYSTLSGTVSQHTTLIQQTSQEILLCATISGSRSAGSVLTNGSYISISNDSITLATGGKLICTASQIQIGTNTTLQSRLTNMDNSISTASSNATSAKTLAEAIRDGSTKAKYAALINNTGITIDDTDLQITARGTMQIAVGGSLSILASDAHGDVTNAVVLDQHGIYIASGGTFEVQSNNFGIDAYGDVYMVSGNWYFDEYGALFKNRSSGKYVGIGDFRTGQSPDIKSIGGIYFDVSSGGYGRVIMASNNSASMPNAYIVFESTSEFFGGFYPVEANYGTIRLGSAQHHWYDSYLKTIHGTSNLWFYPYNSTTSQTYNNYLWQMSVITQGEYDRTLVFDAYVGTEAGGVSSAASMIGQPSNIITYVWANTIYYYTMTQLSSRYIKRNIVPLPSVGDRLQKLEPVSFIYNADKTNTRHYGLIWEDTIDILPEICLTGKNGEKSINYIELVPMLLKEIQDLRKEVAEMKSA